MASLSGEKDACTPPADTPTLVVQLQEPPRHMKTVPIAPQPQPSPSVEDPAAPSSSEGDMPVAFDYEACARVRLRELEARGPGAAEAPPRFADAIRDAPDGDVAVRRVPRVRATEPPAPAPDAPAAVRAALRFFAADDCTVERTHRRDTLVLNYDDPPLPAAVRAHTTLVRTARSETASAAADDGAPAAALEGSRCATPVLLQRSATPLTASLAAAASSSSPASTPTLTPTLTQRSSSSTAEAERDGAGVCTEDTNPGADDALLDARISAPERGEAWPWPRAELAFVFPTGDYLYRNRDPRGAAPTAYEHSPAVQVAVAVRSLRFDACDVEPLAGTLFTYCPAAHAVTSEPFHFDVTPDTVRAQASRCKGSPALSAAAPASAATTAVFTVATAAAAPDSSPKTPKDSRDVYLVLGVSKVAQINALSTVAEVYGKTALSPEAEGALAKKFQVQTMPAADDAADGAAPCVPYQPVAWSVLPLYVQGACACAGAAQFTAFYRHANCADSAEFDAFLAGLAAGSTKKLVPLHAHCEIDVTFLGVARDDNSHLRPLAKKLKHAPLPLCVVDASGQELLLHNRKKSKGDKARKKAKGDKSKSSLSRAGKSAAGTEVAGSEATSDGRTGTPSVETPRRHKHHSHERDGAHERDGDADSAPAGTTLVRVVHAMQLGLLEQVGAGALGAGAATPSPERSRATSMSASASAGSDAAQQAAAPKGGRLARTESTFEPAPSMGVGGAGAAEQVAEVQTAYENLLFVRPRLVVLPSGVSTSLFTQTHLMVQVEVVCEARDGSTSQSLAAFFAPAVAAPSRTCAFTLTAPYAPKATVFQDVLKAALPQRLGAEHFLLFTVYQVTLNKKSAYDVVPVGYAHTPLCPGGQLAPAAQTLAIRATRPPSLRADPAEQRAPDAVLRAELLWCTTVYSRDALVQDLFACTERAAADGPDGPEYEDEEDEEDEDERAVRLADAIRALPGASAVSLVRHLPTVLELLFGAVVAGDRDVGVAAVATVAAVVKKLGMFVVATKTEQSRVGTAKALLETFVRVTLRDVRAEAAPPGGATPESRCRKSRHRHSKAGKRAARPLHEGLVDAWLQVLVQQRLANTFMDLLSYAWFLFAAIAKLMALAADRERERPRGERFSERFRQQLVRLLDMMRGFVEDGCGEKLAGTVAAFVQDLFAVMDRGFVLALAKRFVEGLHSHKKAGVAASPPQLQPPPPPQQQQLQQQQEQAGSSSSSSSSPGAASRDLAMIGDGDDKFVISSKLHFLRLMCQYEHYVALNLPEPPPRWYAPGDTPVTPVALEPHDSERLKQYCSYRFYGARRPQFVLADLLLHHVENYSDARLFSEDVRKRAYVALADVLVQHDFDPRLQAPAAPGTLKEGVANMYLGYLDILFHHTDTLFPCVAGAPALDAQQNRREVDSQTIASASTLAKAALFCFLWLVRNASTEALAAWVAASGKASETLERATMLFDLLAYAVHTTHVFRPVQRIREEWPEHTALAKRAMLNTEISLVALRALSLFDHLRDNSSSGEDDNSSSKTTAPQQQQQQQQRLAISEKVLDTYCVLLAHASTAEVVSAVYASLHKWIATEPQSGECLFRGAGDYCARLCHTAVRHCNSAHSVVRANGAALLYFMILQNHRASGGSGSFDRTKVETMIGLSQLVGQGQDTQHVEFIEKSLSSLRRYNELYNGHAVSYKLWANYEDQLVEKRRKQAVERHRHTQSVAGPMDLVPPLCPAPVVPDAMNTSQTTPAASPSAASPAAASPAPSGDKPKTAAPAQAPAPASSSAPPSPGNDLGQELKERLSRRLNLATLMCYSCDTAVLKMDAVEVDGHFFHRNCFRCAACNVQLKPDGLYFPVQGRYYCKQHYQEHFVRTSASGKSPKPARRARAATAAESSEVAVQTGTSASSSGSTAASSADGEAEHYTFSEFGSEVGDLLERLTTILVDCARLRQCVGDDEMTADLYLRIANSYMAVPAIRLTWLECLGQKDQEMGLRTEAALVLVHECALVAELLQLRSVRERGAAVPYLPAGWRAFRTITSTVVDESQVAAALGAAGAGSEAPAVPAAGATGLGDGLAPMEDKLVALMERAMVALKAADLYELAYRVGVLLARVYEHRGHYAKLRNVCAEQTSQCQKLVDCASGTRTRTLGTYYRVALFGRAFDDLNGREYVTRQLGLTRLSELQDALLRKYQARCAPALAASGGHLDIYRDSGAAPAALRDDPVNAHIQLTKVEPYFGFEDAQRAALLAELAQGSNSGGSTTVTAERRAAVDEALAWLPERRGGLAQEHDVRCFVYESPFTRTGKHYTDDMAQQWKRKTFLFVPHALPYTTRRLPVTQRVQLELTPIEAAIETVELQVARLRAEVQRSPPKLKTLQALLQGSCLVMVQQGATEGICRCFLRDTLAQWNTRYVARLTWSLTELLSRIEDALRLHDRICPQEQRRLHVELANGCITMKEQMAPILLLAQSKTGIRPTGIRPELPPPVFQPAPLVAEPAPAAPDSSSSSPASK